MRVRVRVRSGSIKTRPNPFGATINIAQQFLNPEKRGEKYEEKKKRRNFGVSSVSRTLLPGALENPSPKTLNPNTSSSTGGGGDGRDTQAAGRAYGRQPQRRRRRGQPQVLRPRRLQALLVWPLPSRSFPTHGTL